MRRGVVLLALVCGCGAAGAGDVSSTAAHDAVVETYDQPETFTDPRTCRVYLKQRLADENGRTVEYDARVGDRDVSIVYSLLADDAYPLHAALYDAQGANTLTVEAADHALQVLGADGTVLRSVSGYDGDESATTVTGTGEIDDSDGLSTIGCAFADRSALGDVPAFLRNLASGGAVPGQSDVSSSSENPPPILSNWAGKVSLLGAFWLISGCLDAAGWHCGCWKSMNDTVIGSVPGWCP